MPKILLTEDDRSIQTLLKFHLEQAGHEVLVSENGKNTIQLLEKETINLQILDLNLPGLDGKEVLKYSKEHCSSIPIIISARN